MMRLKLELEDKRRTISMLQTALVGEETCVEVFGPARGRR